MIIGKSLFIIKYMSDRIMATFGYMVLMLVIFKGFQTSFELVGIILLITIFGVSMACLFVSKRKLRLFLKSAIIE